MNTDLLDEVRQERDRQDVRWGWPKPFRTWPVPDVFVARLRRLEDVSRMHNESSDRETSWASVFGEEAGEIGTARTRKELRAECIQGAAVLVAWVQALDEEDEDREDEAQLRSSSCDLGRVPLGRS